MKIDSLELVRMQVPEASLLLIIRTLERISDPEEAVAVIKNRPPQSPICWNFAYSKWVSIDALSLPR